MRLGFEHAAAELFHREGEILVRPRPARRIDAGRPAECRDAKAAVVGERGEVRGLRRGKRLQFRVRAEGLAGFLRLVEAEIAGRHRLDAEGRKQIGNLADLAGIVACDDKFSTFEGPRHFAMVSFCSFTRSATLALASLRSERNSSSEKGSRSAVPWISQIPPCPVMTKFASVSASESST